MTFWPVILINPPSPCLNNFGGWWRAHRQKQTFFTSYEGYRQRTDQLSEAVPSQAARARAVPSIVPLLAAFRSGITQL
jgi:hypothetical protein